jgi:hypothetical protein
MLARGDLMRIEPRRARQEQEGEQSPNESNDGEIAAVERGCVL